MDPLFLVQFLLIISNLRGNVAQYGKPCKAEPCRVKLNLVCSNGICICEAGFKAVDDSAGEAKCDLLVEFNQSCVPTNKNCKEELVCSSETFTCQCPQLNDVYVGDKCVVGKGHGERCNDVDAICMTRLGLMCSAVLGGLCDCNIEDGWTWVTNRGTCVQRPVHGESCAADLKCREGTDWNLQCDPGTGLCGCNHRWMDPDPVTGRCSTRPLSTYGEKCDLPEDCAPGLHLACFPHLKQCLCERYYENDPGDSTRCRRIPSQYEETCNVNSDCIWDHHLTCDPTSKRCTCEPTYELNQGKTPCRQNLFNGRTYGQSCDDKIPVTRCVVEHNLECKGDYCVCLDLYIPDETTREDSTLNVTTCKPGGGTQGHGAECKTAGRASTDRCDFLKDLGCEVTYERCTCSPGSIPTGDREKPCVGGTEKYGSNCDPPEVIIPPRSTDPNTGLPYPGPTSPPPPKLACDRALKLACTNGKCGCPDSFVRGRYRLDSKSGKCLITSGHACWVDGDCFSGKCLTIAEVATQVGGSVSHDHGDKVCSDPSRTVARGTILGHSTTFTFLVVFLPVQFLKFG